MNMESLMVHTRCQPIAEDTKFLQNLIMWKDRFGAITKRRASQAPILWFSPVECWITSVEGIQVGRHLPQVRTFMARDDASDSTLNLLKSCLGGRHGFPERIWQILSLSIRAGMVVVSYRSSLATSLPICTQEFQFIDLLWAGKTTENSTSCPLLQLASLTGINVLQAFHTQVPK